MDGVAALYATWLGFLTAAAALGGLALATISLLGRREALEALVARFNLLTAALIAVTTVVALATHKASPSSGDVYTQLFLAASLFALSALLADWRSRDEQVLWNVESRILYLVGHVGSLVLAVALVGLG
jgi:hypothetical protein